MFTIFTALFRQFYCFYSVAYPEWPRLTQLKQRLDPQFFVRIHRNSIVNLSAKFEIKNFNSGRLKLYFDFAQEGVVSLGRQPRLHGGAPGSGTNGR
jgi:hypothetical protein